jgi:hypothetical protein
MPLPLSDSIIIASVWPYIAATRDDLPLRVTLRRPGMSAAAAAFFDSGRHGAGSLIRALGAEIKNSAP